MDDQERLKEMLDEVDASRQEGAIVGAFYRGAVEQIGDGEPALSLAWRFMSILLGEEEEED